MDVHPQPVKQTSDAHCPSCGRYVGPYETCPYCGAKIAGRLPVRLVKLAAILLAGVGLLGLWWLARHTEIPLVTVENASGTMNMAYVRIAGKVSRSITYDPQSGYLAFWVDDGTGEVRVSAYRDVTESLVAARHVPALGDEVRVAGTLRIREDFVALTLNVPEHLEIHRPAPVPRQIDAITQLDEGDRVRVAGEVDSVFSPYEGLTIINVRDAGGKISVAVDDVLTQLDGPLPDIAEGQGIVVTGTVSLYRDSPQLVPATLADIAVSASPPEEVVAAQEVAHLSDLSAADEGQVVHVTGQIVMLEGFKGGVKATLDDNTATLLVLLWDSVYGDLPAPAEFDVGAQVEVRGELKVYRGDLEVVPEKAADVAILTPAPAIPWVAVQDLTAADVGRIVRLRGTLGPPKPFSAGVKVALDDGSGRIDVLLWSNIAETLAPQPAEGLSIEVVGEVAEYKGKLELIPRSAQDWRTP